MPKRSGGCRAARRLNFGGHMVDLVLGAAGHENVQAALGKTAAERGTQTGGSANANHHGAVVTWSFGHGMVPILWKTICMEDERICCGFAPKKGRGALD